MHLSKQFRSQWHKLSKAGIPEDLDLEVFCSIVNTCCFIVNDTIYRYLSALHMLRIVNICQHPLNFRLDPSAFLHPDLSFVTSCFTLPFHIQNTFFLELICDLFVT